MSILRSYFFLGLGSAAIVMTAAIAQNPKSAPAKRVAPPKFRPVDVAPVFFDDLFTKLHGSRPASATANTVPSGGATAAAPLGTPPPAAPGGMGGWSKLISSQTIEDEIKSVKLEVDKNVKTPSDFSGRGYRIIRREYSFLAMLFAIIAEYDGEVRFKKDAASARNLFARTASNTKSGGNRNVYNEAKLRKGDLDELLGGASLQAPAAADTPAWAAIVDRSPLMQRLEEIFQERLSKLLASKEQFTKHKDEILHHAELVAVIGEVLTKETMRDADDPAYTGFANSLKAAAVEIVDAAKLDQYEQARTAAGRIDKACSQCHERFQ